MNSVVKTPAYLAVLVSCFMGCGGGSDGTEQQASSVNAESVGSGNQQTSTPDTAVAVDKRISFVEFSDQYQGLYGDTSVSYRMTPFESSAGPTASSRYQVSDYGFLQVTVDGSHQGSNEGAESTTPGPFINGGYWYSANLNDDGIDDMLFIGHHDGALDWVPGARMLAWINNGEGHFQLDASIFPEQTFPCVYGNNPQVDSPQVIDPCGFTQGNNYPIVADFNGDGISDYFNLAQLFLSDNGKLTDRSLSHLPDIFFQPHIGPVFSHRFVAGDLDSDGDLDIFLPVNQVTKMPFNIDGTFAGCEGCNQELPWIALINDGFGRFSMNTEFDKPSYIDGQLIWPTATTLGDFNGDGHQDIAVGWESPGLAEQYGWRTNSAGNLYLNSGDNNWRTQSISLPAAWYDDNSIIIDMQTLDFNGDQHIDIVMQVTKHKPYYRGNVIQFLQNDGLANFIDVTKEVNPQFAKYQDGSGSDFWNGGGVLQLIDFDGDGDLDIVSSSGRSYVLLNNTGRFTLMDDLPLLTDGDGGNLWPIKLNSAGQYGFIGQLSRVVSGDRSITTYYQVVARD